VVYLGALALGGLVALILIWMLVGSGDNSAGAEGSGQPPSLAVKPAEGASGDKAAREKSTASTNKKKSPKSLKNPDPNVIGGAEGEESEQDKEQKQRIKKLLERALWSEKLILRKNAQIHKLKSRIAALEENLQQVRLASIPVPPTPKEQVLERLGSVISKK